MLWQREVKAHEQGTYDKCRVTSAPTCPPPSRSSSDGVGVRCVLAPRLHPAKLCCASRRRADVAAWSGWTADIILQFMLAENRPYNVQVRPWRPQTLKHWACGLVGKLV